MWGEAADCIDAVGLRDTGIGRSCENGKTARPCPGRRPSQGRSCFPSREVILLWREQVPLAIYLAISYDKPSSHHLAEECEGAKDG